MPIYGHYPLNMPTSQHSIFRRPPSDFKSKSATLALYSLPSHLTLRLNTPHIISDTLSPASRPAN